MAIVAKAGSSPATAPNQTYIIMENKEINKSIVDFFTGKYPGVKVGDVRWAASGIAPEFRSMSVGDIVLFATDKYNYQSIRSTPGTVMVQERMQDGREWTTRVDYANKVVAVMRVS